MPRIKKYVIPEALKNRINADDLLLPDTCLGVLTVGKIYKELVDMGGNKFEGRCVGFVYIDKDSSRPRAVIEVEPGYGGRYNLINRSYAVVKIDKGVLSS